MKTINPFVYNKPYTSPSAFGKSTDNYHANDFVNAKSYAREKPLLAGCTFSHFFFACVL